MELWMEKHAVGIPESGVECKTGKGEASWMQTGQGQGSVVAHTRNLSVQETEAGGLWV